MTLAELDRWLAERNLRGFWNQPHGGASMKPHLWKWADVHEGIQRAIEIVPMDKTGRRVVQPRNPSLQLGMSHTIHLAVQAVIPGEIAKAHRHVAAAIRYVIRGSPKCFTIVEGERFAMEEGDLITTPNWTWHDHFNASDEPVMWVDGLDARLITFLDANLFENFPADQQPVEKPDGYSLKALGHARPKWINTATLSPPFRYSGKETRATLQSLKEGAGDPYDSIHLQYVNPLTGGPTLPTFGCEIQLLLPRQTTRAHRHMSTAVYFVSEGEGSTTIENEVFQWSRGDFFLIPPWQRHAHANRSDQDAILFSINDAPAMQALGIYREEGLDS
jgi:1-hydroxy-2-naphthoate dioxygenase